jgi:hypothetical protein
MHSQCHTAERSLSDRSKQIKSNHAARELYLLVVSYLFDHCIGCEHSLCSLPRGGGRGKNSSPARPQWCLANFVAIDASISIARALRKFCGEFLDPSLIVVPEQSGRGGY